MEAVVVEYTAHCFPVIVLTLGLSGSVVFGSWVTPVTHFLPAL